VKAKTTSWQNQASNCIMSLTRMTLTAAESKYRDGAVITCAACNEEQSSASSNLGHVVLEPAKHDQIAVEIHSTSHCVHQRVGLLVNLLLHERTETACTLQQTDPGNVFKVSNVTE